MKLIKTDMQAFKAANPGCQLSDFIRWHSPRDWVVDESGRGCLSDRMSEPDNLWVELWESALPIPASQQTPFFDYEREAQAAFEYLEGLSLSSILKEYFNSFFSYFFTDYYLALFFMYLTKSIKIMSLRRFHL